MNSDSTWIVLIVIFVVLPLFFWFRVRSINKRKESVNVRCPHCEADQRLSMVKNYTCKECGESVRFFGNDGTPLPDAPMYSCEACGKQNFVGVLTCTACGKGNQAGLPG